MPTCADAFYNEKIENVILISKLLKRLIKIQKKYVLRVQKTAISNSTLLILLV